MDDLERDGLPPADEPAWRLMDGVLARQLGSLERTVKDGFEEIRRTNQHLDRRISELEKWRYGEERDRERVREDAAIGTHRRVYQLTKLQVVIAALGTSGVAASIAELLHNLH